MTMIPDSVISRIESVLRGLDDKTRHEFLQSFSNFADLLNGGRLSDAQITKAIFQLTTYLNKKSDEIDPMKLEKNSMNLRRIRNEIAHGKFRRDGNFSKMYGPLWKAITQLGNRIEPGDLENLLSYSLRIENLGMAERRTPPVKFVAVYRTIFNASSEETKNTIFAELLLRLFSDSETMHLLDAPVKK